MCPPAFSATGHNRGLTSHFSSATTSMKESPTFMAQGQLTLKYPRIHFTPLSPLGSCGLLLLRAGGFPTRGREGDVGGRSPPGALADCVLLMGTGARGLFSGL